MATVYIHLYEHLNCDLSLPGSLLDGGQYEVECLKGRAPDDGEAFGGQRKFSIGCPDDGWKDVLDILRDSEKSLAYSVLVNAANGGVAVHESGEMNATVRHYSTRRDNAKQLFTHWFGDALPSLRLRLAA